MKKKKKNQIKVKQEPQSFQATKKTALQQEEPRYKKDSIGHKIYQYVMQLSD